MSPRTAWSVAFGCAVVVQCWALYTTSPPSAGSDLPLDKLVHFALFAGVGLLGVLAGLPTRWLLLGLALQAIASELIQAVWLSQRGGDVWDLVADLVGTAAGVWLGIRLARRVGARELGQQA